MISRVRNTSFSNCVSFSLRDQICFLSRWNFQLGPFINSISIEPILWAKPGSHMSCVPAPCVVSMLNTQWQMKASGSFFLFSLCFPPRRKLTSGGTRGTRLQAALLHSWWVPCDRWALRWRAEDLIPPHQKYVQRWEQHLHSSLQSRPERIFKCKSHLCRPKGVYWVLKLSSQ